MIKLLFTILFAICAFGQTGRDVVLTWKDTANPPGTRYDVKRTKDTTPTAITSPCSAVTPSSEIATTAANVVTYRDVNPGPGVWCYTVVAWDGVVGSLKSADSNKASAIVRYQAPELDPVTLAIKIDGITATITYAMKNEPPLKDGELKAEVK